MPVLDGRAQHGRGGCVRGLRQHRRRAQLLKRGIHAKYKCKEDAWENKKGHEVQPAIFEVFGGFDEGAVKLLNRWAGKARGKTPPGEEPPWAARNYVPYWSQRISRAIQVGAAQQVEDAVLRLGGSAAGAA